jgi:hypothetical protein
LPTRSGCFSPPQAVERPPPLAPGSGSIGLRRPGAGAFGIEGHDRVECRIALFDLPEIEIEELATPELASPDARGKLAGGFE